MGGITDKLEIEKEEKKLKSEKIFVSKDSTPTYVKTKNLIEKSATILELATNRDVSKGTVIGHLSVLKEQEPDLNLDKYKPDEEIIALIQTAVKKIKENNNKDDFSQNTQIRLKPIFEAIDAKIEYDEIRLALLYM